MEEDEEESKSKSKSKHKSRKKDLIKLSNLDIKKIIEELGNKNYINSLIILNRPIFEILKIRKNDFKNFDKIFIQFYYLYTTYKSLKLIRKNKIRKLNLDKDIIREKLLIPIEKRTFDDIYIIKKFIKKTKLESLFYNEINIKSKLYQKVLVFISLLMKFKFLPKNEIIFRIGDQPDFLYLIIDGKVDILKPMIENAELTGNEYFLKLMNYKKTQEKYIYNQTLQENNINYEIKKKDKDMLPYIYLTYRLKELKKRKFIDFKKVFDIINIPPNELGIDPNKIDSISYIFKNMKHIIFKMPYPINQEDLKYYKFIDDTQNKKLVKIFEYKSFLKLGNNVYFGESACKGKAMRNATIKTEEDCYFGYVDLNLYNINFFNEKKNIFDKKIDFLYNYFFFEKINKKKFEKKFFNWFISETYTNNDLIFEENTPSNYVYFIEEGTVELTSSRSIIETQILLKNLANMNTISKNDFSYNNIKSRIVDIENSVKKKMINKILILGKKNILGLESFYYQIPYLTNARIISPFAKIYKIDNLNLIQILEKSTECIHELENKVKNEMNIISRRFFGLNNVKLMRIDNKIIFDEKVELEKLKNEEKKDTNNNSNFIVKKIQIIKTLNPKHKPKIINNNTTSINHRKNINFNLNSSKNITQNSMLNSAFSQKNKCIYNIKNLSKNNFEKNFLNKIKKEMTLLKKNKFFHFNLEKNSRNEKISEIKKSNSLLGKYEDNCPNNTNNNKDKDHSFEFVTNFEYIKLASTFDKETNIKDKDKDKNIYFPTIKRKNITNKDSFNCLSIISGYEHSSRNISESPKKLNLNFSYNNRVIKNYSFINKYINKEKKDLVDKDPKEIYKIFDKETSKYTNSRKMNKLKCYSQRDFDISEIKTYMPKTILFKNFRLKAKKYQEYRRKMQKKIEELSS